MDEELKREEQAAEEAAATQAEETTQPEEAAQTEPDPLAQMTEERDLYLDRWQRAMAEFDNFRKRTAKEKAGMYDEGVATAATALLPVVDNLERALASVTEESPLKTGVEMTCKQLLEVLAGLGVTPIPALGETFDPNRHNAVLHEDDPDAGENTIVMELQKGYMYKDKVIRYSMVKVAN